MELKLKNLEECFLIRYKILTKDNVEISSGGMQRDEAIINISKEHYNKPLKLIIENSAFSGSHFKSILYLLMYVIGGILGGAIDEGFLKKPITYIYEFTLLGDAEIKFNKNSEKPFNFLKCIDCLNEEKVVYKSQYRKWLLYTFIPLELLISFLAILFGFMLKEYLILAVVPFLIAQIIIYFYIRRFKKQWRLN